MVGGRGIEPLALSTSKRCSTPELTAQSLAGYRDYRAFFDKFNFDYFQEE